ncbi:lanthionine synthetase LanC family protein [Photobacterium arenosum]|uniref:lanthionine synthetase LanC family protein n=1 Tax=Photobacterium arenosum TaxID=2774143 RepID=UPI00288AAE93|nr:lanthionine synthetase LanC family protein [Photobacterium arenosum]
MSSIWAKEPDRINIINSLLHDICSYLNEKATDTDPSLYRGLAGQLLFQWNLRKYNESLVDLTRFEKKFDMFQSQMSDLKDISFGKGLSGCCWLLELLSAEADEAEYDQEINRDFELYLAETFSDHQWSGDYELVFGLAGYAAFCRRRFINNPHEKAYRSILETLTRSAVNTKDGLSWSTPVSSALRFNCSSDNEFNLGVAHGVGSAIATLSFALPLIGDEWQQIKGILERSCQCLLANHNSPEASTFFGYYAGQTCETRLGWCYGDLSAAWVLSNAASALKDEAMLSRAKEIALASTHRTLQGSGVDDGGLCHGSSGLFHIYRKLYKKFGLSEFYDAADYWLDYTLSLYREKGLSGLNQYVSEQGVSIENAGLLEGYSGIGLCLLTAVGVDDSWDDCLLLS